MKDDIFGLGPLEAEIMDCLWVHGPLTIKQIYAKINAYRTLAYMTVVTVCGRLEAKGVLMCHTPGRPRVLTPAVTRVELLTHIVRAHCRSLNASDGERAALLIALSDDDA